MKNTFIAKNGQIFIKFFHRKETALTMMLWAILLAGVLTWQSDALSISPLFFANGTALPQNCAIPFTVEETLMLPTKNGVSLIMTPAESATLFVEYGSGENPYEYKTAVQTVSAGKSAKFKIDQLSPDQTYTYRVQCKPAGQRGPFAPRSSHTSATLPSENETFSFAYATDSHAYAQWAQNEFKPGGGTDASFALLLKNFENLAADTLKFFVIGGDWVMTNCHNCKGGIADDGVSYPTGDALSLDVAEQRYTKIFSPKLYGSVTKKLPFVYVLGNHDGEQGFTTGIETCESDSPTTKAVSEQARLAMFQNPANTYRNGDPLGRYYKLEAGDADIFVLDLIGGTAKLPLSADDWSLGSNQLAWFEKEFKKSKAMWKFVFAEHLVGGESGPTETCYYYGRGSIKATDTDKIDGTLKGEQAVLQTIMKDFTTPSGATIFASGHDHLALGPNEVPGSRVFYVTGGTFAGGAPWTIDQSFQKEMDIDGNGQADYYSNTNGSVERGYFRITVAGKESVTFDYVQATDSLANGTVLYSKTISAE